MQVSVWQRWVGRGMLVGSTALTLWACTSVPLPPYTPTSSVAPVPRSEPASAPRPVTPPPVIASSAAPPAMLESPGVAARFPEPAVTYPTPAFEPGHAGYTSNAELRTFIGGLVRDGEAGSAWPNATTIRKLALGSSQAGVPIEALHFSREPIALAGSGATARQARPTVLLVGQQHGDEPAGAEALIAVAQLLADSAPGGLSQVLDRIDVVILPRANPDGAANEKRLSASGIDINRDHLLLRTPEAQAQAQLERDFNPMVVVDAHEYLVLGRFEEKFNAVQRFDALIQYAMVANEPEFVTRAAEEWFRQPMLKSLKSQGLSAEWYHTTSADPTDRKLAMGGVQPDIGRNASGLRNAVSLLIETRGIGLGRTHLLRRVHTQVTAISSVLKSAAARADDLRKLRRFVDADVAGNACRGEMIVAAAMTPSEHDLQMLDPRTGADKSITVQWDSALALSPLKRRVRPCGYWLSADQSDAAMRLRGLGVQVQRLDEGAEIRGELYTETGRELGRRDDALAGINDAGGVLNVTVSLTPALLDVRAGSYYVGLDQPLANLAAAALEPDTPYSFVANRVISGVDAQARVLARPTAKMTPLP